MFSTVSIIWVVVCARAQVTSSVVQMESIVSKCLSLVKLPRLKVAGIPSAFSGARRRGRENAHDDVQSWFVGLS